MTIAEVVGLELKRLRLREGMTQSDVARELDLAREIVARRERGKHLVTLDNIEEHARACGGSLGHVLVQVDIARGSLRQGAGR